MWPGVLGRRREAHVFKMQQGKAQTILKFFSVKKGEHLAQASGDGMVVKDTGNRKRRKLGRKAKDFCRKTSEGGLPPFEDAVQRRSKCGSGLA